MKVQARDERINEMKREIDTFKSESSTMNSMIVALRNRVKEVEGDLGSFETVASKSGITIHALQKDNKELQQHVLDLESRIRYLLIYLSGYLLISIHKLVYIFKEHL